MARLLGVDIPDNKRVIIALTYIYGIGSATAKEILKTCAIDEDLRVKNLDDDQLAKIRSYIEKNELIVEGELRRVVSQNIRRLREIKSYRGIRHTKGLPVRGQRTSTNSRTRKGKRKTVGGAQKKATAKK